MERSNAVVSVDRSTAATVDQSLLGVAEKCNLLAFDITFGQGQDTAVILEENDTLGTSLTDKSLMLGLVDGLLIWDSRVFKAPLSLNKVKDVESPLQRLGPGISRSKPALRESTVELTPPQSLMTSPSHPHSPRRTCLSRK
jgi:hypothetical protein